MPPDRLPPAPLRPGPDDYGFSWDDLEVFAADSDRAWELFADTVWHADLDAHARRAGWTGREIVARVGAWPFARGLDDLVAEAAAGAATVHDSAQLDLVIRAEVAGLTDDDVMSSVEQARAETQDWLAGDGPERWGRANTSSPLGPLPLMTVVHAMSFQLAVAALDLEPCGLVVPEELLELGLVALMDTVGALAARADVSGTFTAHTPPRTIGVGSLDRRWRVADLPPGTQLGPGVEIGVRELIDVTSGNGSPAHLLRTGSMRVHDLPGTLQLAPALQGVPGIPPIGTNAVSRAMGVLGAVGGVLGRLRR
jgi:hypothetical protein